MITTWIITIITFLLGYGLAVFHYEPEIFKTSLRKIKRKLRKPDLGSIQRPTAEQLRKKGTKLEETEKVMDDTFKKIL